MNLTTSRQIRETDRAAIQERGIPSDQLMETAAAAVVSAAEELALFPSAAIFCGSGNNGGDGIAAARFLLEKGWKVRAFLTGRREKMTADSMEMERRLLTVGGQLEDYTDSDEQRKFTFQCGVIIDAIFGIGLNSDLRSPALEAVEVINQSPAPVVSADIASGIQADTGRVLGAAVRADRTVTFSLAKPGHYSDPGSAYSGEVTVTDIGIPEDLLSNAVCPIHAILPGDVRLPKRPEISHKGTFGKLLLIGGAPGFTGAPTLCARAALRGGAGLVWLGVPEAIYPITAVKNDEAMPFAIQDAEDLLRRSADKDVVAIGPGLGRSPEAIALCQEVIRGCGRPMILDADALYAVSRDLSVLDSCVGPVILTPHDVEFQRMGGELTGDRPGDALRFARAHHCILVLKGHRTVIAFPDGRVFLNTTGNAGMAKGGSGDVLTGILAAMVAQFGPETGTLTGVYLHGLSGDLCRAEYGEYSMNPTDVIDFLPKATRRLCGEF